MKVAGKRKRICMGGTRKEKKTHLINNSKMNGLLSQKETVELNGKYALWSRTARNPDCSTGPLAHPFALLLVPLSSLLAR